MHASWGCGGWRPFTKYPRHLKHCAGAFKRWCEGGGELRPWGGRAGVCARIVKRLRARGAQGVPGAQSATGFKCCWPAMVAQLFRSARTPQVHCRCRAAALPTLGHTLKNNCMGGLGNWAQGFFLVGVSSHRAGLGAPSTCKCMAHLLTFPSRENRGPGQLPPPPPHHCQPHGGPREAAQRGLVQPTA